MMLLILSEIESDLDNQAEKLYKWKALQKVYAGHAQYIRVYSPERYTFFSFL